MNQLKSKGIGELFYLIWMGVFPVSSSILLGYYGFNAVEVVRNFTLSQMILFWGSSIFVLGLGFFPTTFFALFCGYMWGIPAILPMFIVYVLASVIGYGLAKIINGKSLLAMLKSNGKVNEILSNVERNSVYWVFLVRLSPVFPFAITNTLLAYLKINLRSFLIGGSLGMLPRSLMALWIGSQAATWEILLKNPEEISVQNVFSLALLIISGFGMIYLIRKNSITK